MTHAGSVPSGTATGKAQAKAGAKSLASQDAAVAASQYLHLKRSETAVRSMRLLGGANSDTKCTTPGVRGRGNLGHFWFLPTAKQRGTEHEVSPDHLG